MQINWIFLLLLIGTVVTYGLVEKRVSLDDKVHFLQEQILKKPLLNLNLDRWQTYVKNSPRNYSMVVMFTVINTRMNCPICKPAYEEFLILANSFRYGYLQSKALYFGIVDYEHAPQVFQEMGLNTAPALYFFSAKSQLKSQDSMDFQRMGIDAEAMAKFVQERTDFNIRIVRPPNYTAPLAIFFCLMLLMGLLYLRRNNLEFLSNRTLWGVICLSIVFAFMSGQMWNHIRGPPFVMTNSQTRETSFIHGSTQFQLVAETYIVLGIYAAITIGVVVLNNAAIGKIDSNKRRLLSCVGLGMVVIFFSLLLSIFRSKYQGYPYHFLFS